MPQESHYKNAILDADFECFHYNSPPEAITLHEHDFHEIYVFLSGQLHFQLDGSIFPLEPGDIIVAPRSVLHTPVFISREPYERIVIWMKDAFVHRISTAQTDLSRCFRRESVGIVHKNKPAATRLAAFFNGLDENAYGADLRTQLLLTDLLLALNESGSVPEPVGGRSRYAELTHYIRENLGQDLSLDTLAPHCYVSKYHLLRDFKQAYGITLHQYILKERLSEAKRLLLAGLPAAEVGRRCGFADYSGFLIAFKREYNVTPTAYFKLMKGQKEEG